MLLGASPRPVIKAPETALERLTESRRLAADVLVQLTKAADASNRAVMAGTDDGAKASAQEAASGDRRPSGLESTR